MEKRPLISIGVSTYNRKSLLADSLRSILEQSFQDFEVIVVDDGSSDGTEEMVRREFPQVRYFYQENAGDAAAKNFAAAHAAGNYLLFHDSDDIMLAGALEKLYEPLKTRPDAVSYGRYITIDQDGVRQPTKGKVRVYPSGDVLPVLLQHIIINNCATMIPVHKFREIGGYDSSLRCAYDYKFALELALTANCIAVDDPVFLRRRHSGNISAASYAKQHVVLDVFDGFIAAHPEVMEKYPEIVRVRRADLHGKLAREAQRENLHEEMKYHLQRALQEKWSLRYFFRYLADYAKNCFETLFKK